MKVIARPVVKKYIRRMKEELKEIFPDQFERLGDGAMEEAMEYGLSRADAWGFQTEDCLSSYLVLMFTFGRDFDTGLSWAADILRSPGSPGERKDRLLEEGLDREDEGYGLLGEDGQTPGDEDI